MMDGLWLRSKHDALVIGSLPAGITRRCFSTRIHNAQIEWPWAPLRKGNDISKWE